MPNRDIFPDDAQKRELPTNTNGRWSRTEISAAITAAVGIIGVVLWFGSILTDIQVQFASIEARLDGMDETLKSVRAEIKELREWHMEHIDGHTIIHVDEPDTLAGD